MVQASPDPHGVDYQWTHPNSFYSYQHLETPSSFRLLEIKRCSDGSNTPCNYSLIETTFDQAPQYEALSYVWGTTDRSETVALEDGKLLRITRLLKEALAFVESQCATGYLWIDQICIDQDDRSERGHQVKLMGQIYTSCARVLVWLGRMRTPGVEGLSAEDIGRGQVPKDTIVPKMSPMRHLLHGLRKAAGSGGSPTGSFWEELLQLPWFQRAWVFQEVVLPPSAMFILATTSTLPDQARTISLSELHTKVKDIAGADAAAVDNIRIMYLRYSEHRSNTAHPRSPIEQTLSHLAPRAKTSEPLDRLYAFFGLNPDPRINLTPSYDSSLEAAMMDTATAIVEGTHSLDLFDVIPRAKAKATTKRKVALPTWTPDFSTERLVVPFAPSQTAFRERAAAAPGLYPVFIPTHITYYRTTHRGSIYCAGEEKRTIQAHGYVLDQLDTEVGSFSCRTGAETQLDALLERSIEAWGKIKKDVERELASASGRTRKGAGLGDSTVDLGFASRPTGEKLRRALVAEGCCARSYDYLPSCPSGGADGVAATMMLVMRGRTLWMTRSGRFALGSYLRCGDYICVAYGCSNPIALRGEKAMRALGTCFLEGWMDPWGSGCIERVEEGAAPTMFHIV
ncbi:HET-domain-containing protein [Karstenula rhodostoma CBS 690.94]|uniref:HET-domain-containing protein n=1 Tax=Karstenula rhodostoma CBS 690.94 TaxID=1392251 RepID=A0A9P4PRH6_9PLEO|nr:HET-domain-containing protein [Karstenula rhodostoma CBS 690.94]